MSTIATVNLSLRQFFAPAANIPCPHSGKEAITPSAELASITIFFIDLTADYFPIMSADCRFVAILNIERNTMKAARPELVRMYTHFSGYVQDF
jgi:hypothetical protein